MNEQDNTTTARIYPPKQVLQPIYIDFADLEAIKETEQAKRRERIDEFRSRNW